MHGVHCAEVGIMHGTDTNSGEVDKGPVFRFEFNTSFSISRRSLRYDDSEAAQKNHGPEKCKSYHEEDGVVFKVPPPPL